MNALSSPGPPSPLPAAPLARLLAPSSPLWTLAASAHADLPRAAGHAVLRAASCQGLAAAVAAAAAEVSERRVRAVSQAQCRHCGPAESAKRGDDEGEVARERDPHPHHLQGEAASSGPLLRFTLSLLQRVTARAGALGDAVRGRVVELLVTMLGSAAVARLGEAHAGALKLLRQLWGAGEGDRERIEATLASVLALEPPTGMQQDALDWLVAEMRRSEVLPQAPLRDDLLREVLRCARSPSQHVLTLALSALGKAVVCRPLTPWQTAPVASALAGLLSHPSGRVRVKASEILQSISPYAGFSAHPR